MSNFEWNDTIAKMNKATSLNKLLLKLRVLWLGGRCNVNLYTPMRTLGMGDFKDEYEMTLFITNCIQGIDMMYIRSNFGEWEIYLHNYRTFRFNNNTDNSKTVHIEMFDDSEIIVKI